MSQNDIQTMSQNDIQTTSDLDIINLWADEELFGENIENMEQEGDLNLIPHLRSKKFESLQKTIFYRLCGLVIAQLEGSLNVNDLPNLVREFLYEFTEKYDLVEHLVKQLRLIVKEIKTVATHNNYYGNGGIKSIPKTSENIRKKILFVDPIETNNFTNILEFSDFSLLNRVELSFYAVMLELGFNSFNQQIRSQIEPIRQKSYADSLPVYRKGIDLVINHIIYLTNRTYGIMYSKFYNKILKQFVDRI